jgi:alanine racemase
VGARPIMAVVKCNAYGHGDIEIATALQRISGVRHFMVVKTREAAGLRQNGVAGMILNVGTFSRQQIPDLLQHDISQAVYTSAVDELSAQAGRAGMIAKVHIYVDTGMGRVGVPHGSALAFIEKVARLPNVNIEGTFTDMTEDDDFNPVQIERLTSVCNRANNRGIDTGIRHAASTAEVDRYPYAWLDMVRPGSCIVGLEPERQHNLAIRPVMSFKTRVAYVKTLRAGETLSYHRAYKIEKETRIATLPCGYSDGYPPVVTNLADVLIRGRRHRVVGPITANHMMVDVTHSPEIVIGDEVVLWGEQGDQRVTLLELEQHAPEVTNTYRIATRTRTYLPRVEQQA